MTDSQTTKLKVLTKKELLAVSGGEASAGSGVYEAGAGSGKPK